MTAEMRVLPDLDERTKEELQPPCDMLVYRAGELFPCERPASTTALSDCPKCGTKRDLLCMPHGGYALSYTVVCSTCKSTLAVLRVEPLR